MTKLTDDLLFPIFPSASTATASQLKNALNNINILNFYKEFAQSQHLAILMRQRYLEAITFSNALTRINILKQVLNQRSNIRNLGNLSNDLLNNLSNSNVAFGFATFKVNGQTHRVDFISVSGVDPSKTLLESGVDKIDGKKLIPKAIKKKFRFFKYNKPIRAQDTEVKIIEYIMDEIAKKKNINLPNDIDKSQFIDQVLNGSDLKLNITSEMKACESCDNVMTAFNSVNSNNINFSGGTNYYE